MNKKTYEKWKQTVKQWLKCKVQQQQVLLTGNHRWMFKRCKTPVYELFMAEGERHGKETEDIVLARC